MRKSREFGSVHSHVKSTSKRTRLVPNILPRIFSAELQYDVAPTGIPVVSMKVCQDSGLFEDGLCCEEGSRLRQGFLGRPCQFELFVSSLWKL